MAYTPQVELLLGTTWTDITAAGDVFVSDGITITRGRSAEGSEIEQGRCSLTLNNKSGKYSPRNPVSPYYGLLGRNTPLRVSVNTGPSYLVGPGGTTGGTGVQTPDAAALDIVGDLDARVDASIDNWSTSGIVPSIELAGKFNSVGNQRSWLLHARNGGLHFEWSADGTTTLQADSTAKLPVPSSRRLAVRVTIDVDNGAAGNTVTFYTAPSLNGTWTQLGTPIVTAGVTSIFNSTAPLRVGRATDQAFTNPLGQVWGGEIRSGIGGTVVANPTFTSQTPGAASFTDSTGKVWTVGANASISNRKTRFIGEVSSWPPKWHVSGNDVRTTIEAGGILRRLNQGASPLDSTLRRRIPSGSPLAYWPMEDGADATQASSPITGVRPLRTTGFTFASDASLAGSQALPTIAGGATMSGSVPAPTGSVTSWHTEFIYFLQAGPATARTVMMWDSSGTVRTWRLMLDSGGAQLHGYDADGVEIVTDLTILTGLGTLNAWTRWQLWASQSGGTVNWTQQWVPIGGSGALKSGSFTGSVGRITGVHSTDSGYSSDLAGLRLGHISVFTTAGTGIYNSADIAFAGETAGTRIVRVAGEEGVPVTVYGDTSQQVALGPQRAATLLDVYGAAANADGGVLYEQRNALALAYRDRIGQYNQTPTLALTYGVPGLAPPLEPVDDDRYVRNDRTVIRDGGSSATETLDVGALSTQSPPNGVGRYDDSVTLSLATDDQCDDQAGWRLHLGTWDEARFPSVRVNLARAPGLIDAATTVDVHDRITISNPPAWLPPDQISLLAEGYTETIFPTKWDITYVCSPEGPWRVGVADDPVLGRADTDGSALAASYTATDTVISVTSSGPPWTTDPSDTPFDIRVAGEVMTVAALGTVVNSNPLFGTDTAGWSGSNAAIARSTAIVYPGGAAASLLVTPNGSSASGGANNALSAVGTLTPAATYVACAWVYSPLGWADLRVCFDAYDSAGTFLSTVLGAATVVPAGTWTFLTQTLTAPASASRAITRVRHGGTPAATDIYYAWAIRLIPTTSVAVASPQTMTVIRSVNTVVKAQASGAAVSLAYPAYVAL